MAGCVGDRGDGVVHDADAADRAPRPRTVYSSASGRRRHAPESQLTREPRPAPHPAPAMACRERAPPAAGRAGRLRHAEPQRERAPAGAAPGPRAGGAGRRHASRPSPSAGTTRCWPASAPPPRCCSTPTSTPCRPTAGYTAPPHAAGRAGRPALRPGRGRHQGGDRRHPRGAGRPQRGQGGRPRDVAVLFSGDEEKGATRAPAPSWPASAARGLRAGHRLRAHRLPGRAPPPRHRLGRGGRHLARRPLVARRRPAQPLVILARAAVALDELGQRHRALGPQGFRGLCLNVAALDGGVAFNVDPQPGRELARVGAAARRAATSAAILAELEARGPAGGRARAHRLAVVHANPPFATRDLAAFEPLLGERARSPVDLAFWTEAALLRRGRHRRGRVRAGRHRPGPRRRRVRRDRPARDGARRLRRPAVLTVCA